MITKNEEGGAYWAAIRGGYKDEATKHMEILNQKGRWSKWICVRPRQNY